MTLNLDKDWRKDPMENDPRYFPETKPPRTGGLWVAVGLLFAALIGASVYGYYQLKKENIPVSQFPEMLASTKALGEQVGDLERKMGRWADEWNGMGRRIEKLEGQARRGLAGARKHAEELVTQLEARVLDQMDERDHVLNTRMTGLEERQQAESLRMAELERELAATRLELAQARGETDRDLADLRTQLARNEGRFQTFAERFDQHRVDFEISKNSVHELAPGVTVKVTGTDPRYQKFRGWIFFEPDARTLWLNDQGAQRPVIFYGREGGRKYELVVTSVRKDSAIGYLLMPGAEPHARQAQALTPPETGEFDAGRQPLAR